MEQIKIQRLSLASQIRYARKRIRQPRQELAMKHYYSAYLDGLQSAARLMRHPRMIAVLFALLLCVGCAHVRPAGELTLEPGIPLVPDEQVTSVDLPSTAAPDLGFTRWHRWHRPRKPQLWRYCDGERTSR
jgi:hypothetical protein